MFLLQQPMVPGTSCKPDPDIIIVSDGTVRQIYNNNNNNNNEFIERYF